MTLTTLKPQPETEPPPPPAEPRCEATVYKGGGKSPCPWLKEEGNPRFCRHHAKKYPDLSAPIYWLHRHPLARMAVALDFEGEPTDKGYRVLEYALANAPLSDLERQVAEGRWWSPGITLLELSRTFGLSREGIRHVETRVKRKIHQFMQGITFDEAGNIIPPKEPEEEWIEPGRTAPLTPDDRIEYPGSLHPHLELPPQVGPVDHRGRHPADPHRPDDDPKLRLEVHDGHLRPPGRAWLRPGRSLPLVREEPHLSQHCQARGRVS